MSPIKKLLYVGGGHADIPMIKAARKLGYFVITTGNRPEDLGHAHGDAYYPTDYSDPEAVLGLARRLDIDAVCPCCNDFSALSSAYVAENLGLAGHDSFATAQIIHHKDLYREFAHANGIRAPQAIGLDGIKQDACAIDDLKYPLIVKPVDLTGGKGISTVRDASMLKGALTRAFAISKSGRVVVEEYIEGSRHGMSAFVNDGKVVFHFTDNEYYHLNPYLVSGASAPSTVPAEAISELVSQSNTVVKLLNLKNGIFHIQFILQGDVPTIVEICRRPPGDLYVDLVRHATGVNYPEWIVRGFCGLDCSGLTQREVVGYYLRHCIMASRTGVLETIRFDPSIRNNVVDEMLWWQEGEEITDLLVAKFGIVFLKFNSQQELLARSDSMQELIQAVVKPDDLEPLGD